jgi:hypothetical protein
MEIKLFLSDLMVLFYLNGSFNISQNDAKDSAQTIFITRQYLIND